MFLVWSRWSLTIWLPWSVIRFRWSLSTNCLVIGKGEISNFNIVGYDRGDHWLSIYLDQWSYFSDQYILFSNRAKGKLPVSILVGLVEVITDYLTTLFRDQISVIAKYKLSSDRAREKLPVWIIFRVWSQWSLTICLPWSVIRFQWSPSTNCPVIRRGKNCQFQ